MTGGRRLAARIGAALAIATLSVGPAVAQLQVEIVGGTTAEADQLADGTVRHAESGFTFPVQLGTMPARKIAIYGSGDVSVDYSLRGGGNGDAWVTFYVYPAEGSFDSEAEEVAQLIREHWNATERESPVPPPSSLGDGRVGWFDSQRDDGNFTTGYALAHRGGWSLKARFTIPEEADADAVARIAAALAEAPWGWMPQSPRQADEAAVAQR